jgi:hypothetical protein
MHSARWIKIHKNLRLSVRFRTRAGQSEGECLKLRPCRTPSPLNAVARMIPQGRQSGPDQVIQRACECRSGMLLISALAIILNVLGPH